MCQSYYRYTDSHNSKLWNCWTPHTRDGHTPLHVWVIMWCGGKVVSKIKKIINEPTGWLRFHHVFSICQQDGCIWLQHTHTVSHANWQVLGLCWFFFFFRHWFIHLLFTLLVIETVGARWNLSQSRPYTGDYSQSSATSVITVNHLLRLCSCQTTNANYCRSLCCSYNYSGCGN